MYPSFRQYAAGPWIHQWIPRAPCLFVPAAAGVSDSILEYFSPFAPYRIEAVLAAVLFLTLCTLVVILAVENRSRRKAQMDLRAALQRLDLHAQNSPLAIVEFDSGYRVTRWSRRAEEIFGWSAAEMLGRRLEDMHFIHEEDFERIESRAEAISAGRQSSNVNVNRNYRTDGSIIICEWYNSAIRDPAGTLISSQSLVLDVTDRRRAQEENENIQRQLLQAQKMESVGRLAGGVAHDFNNMLSVILGYNELAFQAAGGDELVRENLAGIREAANRSVDLTRQLLAFARKQPISPGVMDLNEAVSGLLSVLRRLIGEDITITWTPSAAPWPVRLDRNQVDQIMTNLSVNARDAINGVGTLLIATRNVSLDHAAWMMSPWDTSSSPSSPRRARARVRVSDWRPCTAS